eukprot:128982_1
MECALQFILKQHMFLHCSSPNHLLLLLAFRPQMLASIQHVSPMNPSFFTVNDLVLSFKLRGDPPHADRVFNNVKLRPDPLFNDRFICGGGPCIPSRFICCFAAAVAASC